MWVSWWALLRWKEALKKEGGPPQFAVGQGWNDRKQRRGVKLLEKEPLKNATQVSQKSKSHREIENSENSDCCQFPGMLRSEYHHWYLLHTHTKFQHLVTVLPRDMELTIFCGVTYENSPVRRKCSKGRSSKGRKYRQSPAVQRQSCPMPALSAAPPFLSRALCNALPALSSAPPVLPGT